ncbi:MAG TPA: Error-prone repair protein ImuA [Mucilaginibacter sp.]|jgi:protein ImuA|nr:Error-prone repair protein ImuA [Mucilaginibacter sp.]
MQATKQEIIEKLRQDINTWEGFRPPKPGESESFGLGPIENAFPGRVFPTGVLHEFVSQSPEQTAAIGGFLAGLMQILLKDGGVCIWASYSRRIYPPALKRFGVNPDRFVFIDVQREKDVLWVTEEALKCKGIAAVICETRHLDFQESLRLQLAVEQSQVTGFILRKDAKAIPNTVCLTRWAIRPLKTQLRPGLPGVGHPRWQVDLLRVKHGQPGSWILEWRNKTFQIIKKQNIEQQTARYA